MNIQSITKFAHVASRYVSHNSTYILTGFSVTGVVMTGVLAHKAGELKVYQLADLDTPEEITFKLRLQKTWKLYIPVAVAGAATIASIIATQTISVRRQAAMAAAYSLTREAYSSYREEIKDLLDEKEEQKVYSKVSERQQPEAMSGSMIVGSGDVLCFDSYSGRYFKSSMEKLRKVINDVNFDLVHYDSVSLNDLYSHLGLEQTAMGDELGWQNGQLIEVDYVGILSPDGEPAISLQFKNPPVANWYKFS